MKKGVDIGGSFVKVYWEDGRREKHYIKDLSKNRELFLKRIKEIVLEGNPSSVGVAVAGFTSLEGKVYKSPNIPALDGVNLRELLEGIRVRIVNDVSAGAFGEWFYDHRESKVLLFVAVGTGLGGGLVVEGRPFLGACGSSLELGHHTILYGGEMCSCGRHGCWEAYCSSYGLERLYRSLSGSDLRDYEIIQRAREAEKAALKAVNSFREFLLTGLMNAVHILNPDRVVLGGGLIDAMRDLLGDLEMDLKALCERLPAECFSLHLSSCAEYCMARGALALSLVDDI
ncbi:MAG: ROK family protein [Aquificaceae bacterium]|jgi:glucokinase|uniref:ROK family protein n=1 Tax=Hydrogenobacter sp. Uz 6-8 TaxID=3384828 RepID=UPI0030A53A8A